MRQRYLFLVLLILGFTSPATAQFGIPIGPGGGGSNASISGSVNVTAGLVYQYTASHEVNYWTCNSCEFQFAPSYDPKISGWPRTVYVKWLADGGSPSLGIQTVSYQTANLYPKISCGSYTAPMPTPSAVNQTADVCTGEVTLTHNQFGVDWTYYWQTSANGESTAHSGNSFTVSNNGTYYLRAITGSGC